MIWITVQSGLGVDHKNMGKNNRILWLKAREDF